MPSPTGLSAAHPALAAYATRHRLDPAAFRSDGRITLQFDGRYRIQLRPAADGRIAITARLQDLAGRPAAQVEDALQRLAVFGSGLLREHASSLCIDGADDALMLQQVVPASADADLLEAEIAAFVNALSLWTRVCARELAGAAA